MVLRQQTGSLSRGGSKAGEPVPTLNEMNRGRRDNSSRLECVFGPVYTKYKRM